MEVELKPVTKDNYEYICELDVLEDQEDHVACNMWSLVESMFNPDYVTRAIYHNSTPAGFIMWVPSKDNEVSIWRFMVDKRYQNRGIGSIALQLALDEIKTTAIHLEKIEICYNPYNSVAQKLYSRFGFIEIGLDEDGEDILATLEVKSAINNKAANSF